MQCSVFGKGGRYSEEKPGGRVPVKAEARDAGRVIFARGNEHFVKPVYMPAIAGNVQAGSEGAAYQPALFAGFSETARSPAGGGGLPHGLRPAADEVTVVAAVADEITDPAGKGEQGGLFCHGR